MKEVYKIFEGVYSSLPGFALCTVEQVINETIIQVPGIFSLNTFTNEIRNREELDSL